jgi:nucleotide-binding universal stress UspA family protein
MKSILVASNDSKTALHAVDAGVDLAANEGAGLVFVHVVSVLEFAPQNNGVDTPPARVPRAEDDPVLSTALMLAAERGISARAELLVGYPATQILRLARDIDADLIVVGTRGLGPVKGAVLGSTSREVVAKAGRPVMVVRETGVRDLVRA